MWSIFWKYGKNKKILKKPLTTKSEVDIIVKLSQESEEKSWKRLKKIRKKVLTKREVSDIINLTDVQEKTSRKQLKKL